MSTVPPGVPYLLGLLPPLLAPPAAVYLAAEALETYADLDVPAYALALACVASGPALMLLKHTLWRWRTEREAARRGAVLPPALKSVWPAGLGLDIVRQMKAQQGEYPGYTILEWTVEYGNIFRFSVFGEQRFFTIEPDHIKAILATDFQSFEKGPSALRQNRSVLGTGVFNADGELWKFHRSMTRPFFVRDRISHFDLFDAHADDALAQLRVRLADGHPVDFQDLVSRFTLDCATQFLFGRDVRSLSAGLPYPDAPPDLAHPANAFAHAFLQAQEVCVFRSRGGAGWPLQEILRDRSREHMDVIRAFVDPIVDAALARKREGGGKKEGEKESDVLLDELVEKTEDRAVLGDEIMNMMVAGRDTTAATLTFAVYMLAEHPDVLRTLRQEIVGKLGTQRRPDPEDLRDMKYLRAVINETLRLFPIVPLNVRQAKVDTTFPGKDGNPPIFVPAGTRCAYSVLLMQRRTDLWGPDALSWDPARFLDERAQLLTKNPMMFLPFNAGPRICLGQQFAYNEASFFLIKLLQRFERIELVPADMRAWRARSGPRHRLDVERVMPQIHLTMYVKDGLWVRMTEAG